MLLLVDYVAASPQLAAADVKTALQPAAFALLDALTSFEVRLSFFFFFFLVRLEMRRRAELTVPPSPTPPHGTHTQIQHMRAALLDSAGQALLKKLHSDYQQRYKYRGKV